ncbi:MFS transporter [Frigoribacterium sp. 2-23]|uniref:MFS transporter n=1 Tax=Frigoribacterium sp. 2-23 TaxID=3415006 RepID=UPI003C6F2C43
MSALPSTDRHYDGGLSRHDVVRWRNALFVVFALSGLAIATWLGRVPAVRDILDASSLEMGLLVAGLSIGSIVAITLSSHVIAAIGARKTVLVALLIVAVGLVVAGLSASLGVGFAGIVVGLAVFGFGNGLCDVGMNVSGAAAERVLGKTVMPLFHAAFSLGTMAGALISAGAEALKVPVAVHVGILALIVAAAAVVITPRLQSEDLGHAADAATEASSGVDEKSTWRDRLAIWGSPSTLLLGLVVLGMATAEGSANDWLALAMVDGHGLSNTGGTVVFFVFVTAMTMARVAGSPLLDRYGRVLMLRLSAVAAIVGLLLVIVSPWAWLAVIGVVFWGFGAALGFPVGLSAAADDSRNAAARVSAVATVGYLAFLALPPVIGFLGEKVGLLDALVIVLVLIAVAGVASGAAREPDRRAALRR